ncbi:hypothetical protein ACV95E_005680, partial [Klebsiella pneumoniae]
ANAAHRGIDASFLQPTGWPPRPVRGMSPPGRFQENFKVFTIILVTVTFRTHIKFFHLLKININ